jgi:excinuclease UvrABC nuclease subunit
MFNFKNLIKKIPKSPGVYEFYDKKPAYLYWQSDIFA